MVHSSALGAKNPGRDITVVRHIEQLERIAESLKERGDPNQVVCNAKAIQYAY